MRKPLTHEDQEILAIFDAMSNDDKKTFLTYLQLIIKVQGTEEEVKIYRFMNTVRGTRRHGINALNLINSALMGNQDAWAIIDASIEASA